MSDRVLPHSLEAERAVLGGVLIENQQFWEVRFLQAGDFFRRSHAHLWAAMLGLVERQEPIDTLTLAEQLREDGVLEEAGGLVYLSGLVDGVPRSTNVVYYAKLVRRKARLRAQIAAAQVMLSKAYDAEEDPDAILDDAQRAIMTLTESGRERPGLVAMDRNIAETVPIIEKILDAKAPISGLRTGFADLDQMTRGLQPGELTILAARPSMGKSALAGNIALNVASRGLVPALFSLEMSRASLTMRMLAARASLDLHKLLSGWISQSEYGRLQDGIAAISQVPLHIDDWAGPTLLDIRAQCRKLVMSSGLDLVIVDYLQLMPVNRKAENRNLAIGEISQGLKALGKELSVPVLALSQLSRDLERRSDKRPILADLRDSGNLEQDADAVWFIYREEEYDPRPENEGNAEVIIAKARNGPTGHVNLIFNKPSLRFDDLARTA